MARRRSWRSYGEVCWWCNHVAGLARRSSEERRRLSSAAGFAALLGSTLQEVPPVGMTCLANRGRNRERLRRRRLAHEPQAGFVRKSVGLEGIDFLLRPNEVLERIAAATVAWDDVIQVAAILADELAGVLADAPVAFEDGWRVTRGMRSGMRSNCVETMTVGTRTWSLGVEIEKSKSRTGSFTHSSHGSGFK